MVTALQIGYSPEPMTQGRMDKTRDKLRRGGLPASTAHTSIVDIGDGRPCDGCGETIDPTERRCTVSITVAAKSLEWRFHDVCYQAWTTYER